MQAHCHLSFASYNATHIASGARETPPRRRIPTLGRHARADRLPETKYRAPDAARAHRWACHGAPEARLIRHILHLDQRPTFRFGALLLRPSWYRELYAGSARKRRCEDDPRGLFGEVLPHRVEAAWNALREAT